jgi:predicted lipoprotein with Yx(FWY)xxD motif
MKKHLASLAAMALMAALAGCGGSPGTTTTTAAPGASATGPATTSPAAMSAMPTDTTAAPAADLMTATTSAGTIVVDAKGMSLYFFTKDTKDSGTSACTGACLTSWPRALTVAATPSADGVTGTLGTITTPEGAKQLTLNGMPLYYYAKDKKPGDVMGQGVGGVWYLANPAGGMVQTTAPAGY